MFKYFQEKKRKRIEEEEKARDAKYAKERKERREERVRELEDYKNITEELKGKEVCFNCKYVDNPFFSGSMNYKKCTRYPAAPSVTSGKYGVSYHNQLPAIDAATSCGEFVKRVEEA